MGKSNKKSEKVWEEGPRKKTEMPNLVLGGMNQRVKSHTIYVRPF